MTDILVIDDSVTCRLYHRSVLETAGFAVSEAINGLDGLEAALRTPFGLILVDINMPLMDGIAFLGALRRDPERRATPVVVISTEAAPANRSRAHAAGANAFLVKPVDPAALVATAGAITGHASLRLVA